jgi:drug/metabolite transporter (DMT)-like permease
MVLLPIAVARGMLRPLLPHWRWVLIFAAFEMAVPFAMLGYAEQRLSSSLAGLLVAAVPLIGAMLSQLLHLDDRLDVVRLAGLLVGVAGVAALVGLDTRGDLLAVGAMGLVATGYAIGPVIVSTRLVGLPSIGVTAVAMALNAVAYAPFAWLTRSGRPIEISGWVAVAVQQA